MPKVKLQAGAELDFLDRKEMLDTLRSWMQENVRGVKFVPFTMGFKRTGATFLIDDLGAAQLGGVPGPSEGFVWSVMNICISGPGVTAADTFQIYDGNVSATRLRVPNLTNAGKSFQKGEFVLPGPSQIRAAGASTGAAGGEIFITGTAIEVPTSQTWMLC